ncbi:asparagine synthase-related protein [Calditrichota bacterium]
MGISLYILPEIDKKLILIRRNMPGIAGIYTNSVLKDWKRKTHGLVRNMVWDRSYLVESIEVPQKKIFFTCSSSGTIPISKIEKKDGLVSVLFGEFYDFNLQNDKNNLKFLHNNIINKYLSKDYDFFKDIDGTYIAAIWNNAENELVLINDTFGSFPIYYCHLKNIFIFSSQIKALSSVLYERNISEISLAERLLLGFSINGKTILENVYHVWPGTILKLKNNRINQIKYFDPRYIEKKDYSDLDNIVSSFSNSISIRFNKNERNAVALSGGFDSRVIWSEIYNQKYPARAVTFGTEKSLDIKIAQEICKKLNIKHKILYLKNVDCNKFDELLSNYITMTEGSSGLDSLFVIPYYEWLRGQFDALFDGTGSALYRRQVFSKYSYNFNSRKNLAKFILDNYSYPVHKLALINKEFINTYKIKVNENLKEYFNRDFIVKNLEDKIDLFYLHHFIAFRFSSDSILQTHYLKLRHPFCDTKTFDLIRNLPLNWRKKILPHKYIINRKLPVLKLFPLVNSNILIPYKGFLWKRILLIMLNKIQIKGDFKFPKLQVQQRPIVDFKFLFQNTLNNFLKNTLLDTQLPLNKMKIENMIESHKKGEHDFSRIFLNLLAIEKSLSILMHDDS